MPNKRFDLNDAFVDGPGNSDYGHGHPRGLDLKAQLPTTTDGLIGIDLRHVITVDEVEAAKGGGGHGGGGGGTGGTSFPNYTAGAVGGYNITIQFNGTWTAELHQVFVDAADRLTALIIKDVPDVTVRSGGGAPKVVDDILITAELGAIDGLYGILGQAGPTSVRTGSSLPATAQMQFDIADVNDMGVAVFSEVVLHEMAHSLGFGSIWDRLGLVSNGQFIGTNANNEYHALGGTGFIPVEQDGGSGTAGSHWDEETFTNELMTGYINDGENYFTAMSAASFKDMGYGITTNYLAWADSGYDLFA